MSAYTKLDEEFNKARKELERSRQSLEATIAAFDDDPTRQSKRRDIVDSSSATRVEKTNLEGKLKETEQLLARYQNEVLSWNQLNTAYKDIWGETVPGYPKSKSSDSEEKREEIRELRKQRLRRSGITIFLKDRTKEINNEVDELGTKVEEIESDISDYDEDVKKEKQELEDVATGYSEQLGDLRESPTENEKIQWLWDNDYRSQLESVIAKEKQTLDGRQIEVNPEGALNLRRKIEALSRGEDLVRTEAAPGELDVEPASAGRGLSESERIREGLDTARETVRPPQETPFPQETPLRPDEPRDPMQIGLEEGLDAQRERQAQERDRRGQARVTDPRQAVPEFGPGTTKGSDDGDGDPEPEGLDEDTRQYIIDNFSLAGFLLQLPDGELSAELEIPPGSGNMVQIDNVMAYINENGLTNQNEIKGLFLQTQWYNNTEPEHRKWQSLWYGEGGEGFQTFAESNANQRALLDDKMDSIRREAERLGLNLDEEDLWKLAYEAQSMGFDTYEIREQFTSTYEDALFASDEGRFEATRNDIRDEAAQYMDTWTDADLDDAAKRVYLGQTTIEEIEAGIRAEAKAANPALASLIDQGYTPKMYFASYKKEAENLLERNVDFLGGDRGLYNQLTGTEWDTEGARPMTRAEFGRTLRGTPEWQYTDNARDSAYDAASQIARMFGGIG